MPQFRLKFTILVVLGIYEWVDVNCITTHGLKELLCFFTENILSKSILGRGWNVRWSVGWFYATFNNISVMSWRLVLLLEETGENHRPVASHWQTLSHIVVSSTPCHERCSGSQVVVNNYHTITTTAPENIRIFHHKVFGGREDETYIDVEK